MARDPTKLHVFQLAHTLVLDVYRLTATLPVEERFALQSQIRRAAVSVAANIVEGCARSSEKEYLHFMQIASASAAEARYLVSIASRLGFTDNADALAVCQRYEVVIRGLRALCNSLRAKADARSHEDA